MIYGEKHPKVLQVAHALDAARAALKAGMEEDGGRDAIMDGRDASLTGASSWRYQTGRRRAPRDS